MTPREPSTPLRRTLLRSHRAVRRAWALRESLPAAATAAAVIAAAVVWGAFFSLREGTAWIRLAIVLAVFVLAVGRAVSRCLARSVSFDGYLERVEKRFPEVRSWLRNALEFELEPPRDTSAELASALSTETGRRLAGIPLSEMVPRLEPRRPA